jgi:hypothetical protein
MRRGSKAARVPYANSLDAPEIAANRRIGLIMSGVIAVSALGAVTLLYTAPFADPPSAAIIEASEAAPLVASASQDAAPKPASGEQAAGTAGLEKPAGAKPDASGPAAPQVADTSDKANNTKDAPKDGSARWTGIYPKPVPVTTTRIPSSPTLASSYADDPSKRVTNAFGSLEAGKNAEPEHRDDVETAAIQPSQMTLPTPRPEYKPPEVKSPEVKPREEKAVTDDEPAEKPAARIPTPSRNVTVNNDVNMRVAPRKHAKVVTVIPDNATVGLVDCDGWCQVVYNDRSGYIYKSFIGNAGSSQPTAKAAPQAKQLTDDPVQRTLTPVGR